MIITWEETDDLAGVLVVNTDTDAHNNRYVIAYRHVIGQKGNLYALIALSDGMCLPFMKKEHMIEKLNDGFAPISHKESMMLACFGRKTP